MNRRDTLLELVVALLLIVGAAMLYLEWWRSGELELLSRRVDELAARRQRTTKPKEATTK